EDVHDRQVAENEEHQQEAGDPHEEPRPHLPARGRDPRGKVALVDVLDGRHQKIGFSMMKADGTNITRLTTLTATDSWASSATPRPRTPPRMTRRPFIEW